MNIFNNRIWQTGLLAFSLTACASGDAPTLSNLTLPQTIVRGQAAQGSLDVADPDGLKGLELQATITAPQVVPIPFAEPDFPADSTAANVLFQFVISDQAPIGNYSLEVIAIDESGEESAPATTQFTVE